MMVERENAKNEQYIVQYNDNPFSEVITYKKHLINNIKSHPKATQNLVIQNFSSESVNDEKFRKFIKIAQAAGYRIYKVINL